MARTLRVYVAASSATNATILARDGFGHSLPKHAKPLRWQSIFEVTITAKRWKPKREPGRRGKKKGKL